MAGEANVPFFTISGSDFVEMFVGVGASRVRDMFEQAKKNSPCIIFIDEIDAVGRHRGAGLGGGNDEREQTLNQLLVEMDGFEQNEGIIIIAATNRPDVLDPALLRPGRFDRQIVISNPDFIGREKILKVHVRKVPLAPDVDLKVVARGTPGFSGADLMNLVNEAALLAARRGKRVVTRQEFEDSRDKIMMGAERRTLIMTEEEKRLTAFHEAGHALVSVSMPASTPIHKATIIPRGRALGMVQSLPERDQISQSYEQLIAMLAMSMGGRVAEELVFGKDKVTSGAAGDIQQVTKIARAMVTRLGFSDKLGTVMYGENQDEVFLGYSLGRQQNISEATAETIDQEVRRLVLEAHDTATRILTERRADLETLAGGLMEFETLSGDKIVGLLQGVRPLRESASGSASRPRRLALRCPRRASRGRRPRGGRPRAPTANLRMGRQRRRSRTGAWPVGGRFADKRFVELRAVARPGAGGRHAGLTNWPLTHGPDWPPTTPSLLARPACFRPGRSISSARSAHSFPTVRRSGPSTARTARRRRPHCAGLSFAFSEPAASGGMRHRNRSNPPVSRRSGRQRPLPAAWLDVSVVEALRLQTAAASSLRNARQPPAADPPPSGRAPLPVNSSMRSSIISDSSSPPNITRCCATSGSGRGKDSDLNPPAIPHRQL